MAKHKDIDRYRENYLDEKNSAALYSGLAQIEGDQRIAEVYRRLAATEERHAQKWQQLLADSGAEAEHFSLSWRTRTTLWLAKRCGIDFVLPTISSMEDRNSHDYDKQPEAAGMVMAEKSHALLLEQMSKASKGAGIEGSVLAKIEGRHKNAGGNALRAAVLGASDGLLSNFNLIMGVAGAELSSKAILLTGFAGLLAGAISMALGEWISVQSSRELYQKQIATEKEEIETAPEEEIEELVLIYQARGLDEATARTMAVKLMSNPETALDTLARDELGVDPDELGGSAWEAAITSFLLFSMGAILPVFPYLFLSGIQAIIVSALVSTAGLFVVGAAITLFTGRSVWYSGTRQVLFGLAAAAVTFAIGHVLGVNIGG